MNCKWVLFLSHSTLTEETNSAALDKLKQFKGLPKNTQSSQLFLIVNKWGEIYLFSFS